MSGVCPVCTGTFMLSKLEAHASTCGLEADQPEPAVKKLSKPTSPHVASIFASKRKSESVAPNGSPSSTSDKKFKMDSIGNPSAAKDNSIAQSPQIPPSCPLAEQLRPENFENYFGQDDSIGERTPLRKTLEGEQLPSMILWGPPGCGKTTLANIIANKLKGRARFVKMSACTCGVAEVREVVKQAKNEANMFKRKTILFMDEVHRFNKAQQDAFLPHIESGVITFIGATTENPSFSLNNALLSRCRVVVLKKHTLESLTSILTRAMQKNDIVVVSSDHEKGVHKRSIAEDALKFMANIVDGDARSALNTLQLVIESKPDQFHINLDHVKEASKRSHVLYDRSGDQHYFMASALQKSIRGSDENASLYWLGRMLKGGEDPTFIARRLVRCASEDVGLGDPTALPLAVAAFQGTQLLGMPECDVLLAQATVHLARAKKSHEVYHGLKAVYDSMENGHLPPVPLHLRNPTSKMSRELGWGKGYSYDLNNVQDISYMPEGMENVKFLQ